MKRAIIAAMLLTARAMAQTGYPYADTPETKWDAFNPAYLPVVNWFSGLVERAAMAGIAGPVVVSTNSVATNYVTTITTNTAGSVTNVFTNRLPTAWVSVAMTNFEAVAVPAMADGVPFTVTSRPYLSQPTLAAMDRYQDGLYARFVSMTVTGASGDYSETMALAINPSVEWVPLSEFPESKARVFHAGGLGYATNFMTNTYGHITNGLAAWSIPPAGPGAFRLASANAELIYTPSGFGDIGGAVAVTGAFWWRDGELYPGYFSGNPALQPGAYWLGGRLPFDRAGGIDDGAAMIWRDYDSRRWHILGDDFVPFWWAYWFEAEWNNLSGFASAPTAAALHTITNWYSWGGGTTGAPVSGSVALSTGLVYRAGSDWVRYGDQFDSGGPAAGMIVPESAPAIRYTRNSAITGAMPSLSVAIDGAAIGRTNAGWYYASETAAVSSASTPLALPWASVTNIRVTGDATPGDALSVIWSNAVAYNVNPWPWYAVSKTNLDERVGALRALRFTHAVPSAFNVSNYYWFGQSTSTNSETAYAQAKANLAKVSGLPDPEGDIVIYDGSKDGFYGLTLVESTYARIIVIRTFAEYQFLMTNAISHSSDLLINASEIGSADYPQTPTNTFSCDIAGFENRGETWIYTNFPSAATNSRSFRLREENTNAPIEGIDYPAYSGEPATWLGVSGFQAPKLQAVIKWEPSF